MAKKAYIGVNNVARKIKKGYVGVNGVARKIKKAYVGVGGVARPFWSGGELAYYGTITELDSVKTNISATSVGNYALFAGGYASTTDYSVVEVYNKSLTKSSVITDAITNARQDMGTTTVGDYALFAGGHYTNSKGSATRSNVVDAYSSSLVKSTPTALSAVRQNISATTVGNYALFAGGRNSSSSINDSVCVNTVDAYSASLTRTIPSSLGHSAVHMGATTVGNYALFAGGKNSNIHADVYAYDTSLTRTILSSKLPYGLMYMGATSVGNYALFAGGYNDSNNVSDVYAFDSSLTMTTISELSVARRNISATAVEDYALFAGGYTSFDSDVVDVYDASLTKTTTTNLSSKRSNIGATTVGNYALFAGGYGKSSSSVIAVGHYYSTVDAYTVA